MSTFVDQETLEKKETGPAASEGVYDFIRGAILKLKKWFSPAVLWALPAVGLCCLTLCSSAAGADAYPSKPVRIVHGYQGGNSIDTNSRIIAEGLSKMLGQQFVVEGKPGATGSIANQVVKESKADGYTLLSTPDSNLISIPHLMKVTFDPFRHFLPISILCTMQYLLVTSPDFPAKNAAELISLAKQKPGIFTYASTGVASGYHLATEKFCLMAGIKMVHVPYRGGGAAAIPDLLKGRISMMMNNPAILLQYVREKKLKAIGVTGVQRLEVLPGVPTIAESGLPGYDMGGAQGMFAPAGTPKEIVLLLNDRIQKVLQEPEVKKKWLNVGQGVPSPHKPEYYTTELHRKYEMYEQLVKATGVKLE